MRFPDSRLREASPSRELDESLTLGRDEKQVVGDPSLGNTSQFSVRGSAQWRGHDLHPSAADGFCIRGHRPPPSQLPDRHRGFRLAEAYAVQAQGQR